MRRRVGVAGLALLAGMVIGVLLQVSGATSRSSTAFYWGGSGSDRQQPVEQESPNFFFNNCGGNPGDPVCDPSTWVSNPTGCAWDLDDFAYTTGQGDIAGTTSASLCVVADGYDSFGGDDKGVYALVFAPKSSLTVTLTNDQGAVVHLTPSPRGSYAWGNGYLWQTCLIDVTGKPNPPSWYPLVAGSNGGTGIPVTYTLSVTSAGTMRGVVSKFEVAGTTGPHFAVTC